MENNEQFNPWIMIWVRPRATVRYLIDNHKTRSIIWLAIIWGGLNGISTLILSWGKYLNYTPFQKFSVVLSNLVLGVLIGIAYLYIVSFIYRVVGSWLQGKGDYRSLRTAIGWSFYPWGVTAIFGLINTASAQNPAVLGITSFLFAALSIWSFIVFVKLMGEAHGFSAWRAVGTVAITLALVLLVVFIIGGVLTLFRVT